MTGGYVDRLRLIGGAGAGCAVGVTRARCCPSGRSGRWRDSGRPNPVRGFSVGAWRAHAGPAGAAGTPGIGPGQIWVWSAGTPDTAGTPGRGPGQIWVWSAATGRCRVCPVRGWCAGIDPGQGCAPAGWLTRACSACCASRCARAARRPSGALGSARGRESVPAPGSVRGRGSALGAGAEPSTRQSSTAGAGTGCCSGWFSSFNQSSGPSERRPRFLGLSGRRGIDSQGSSVRPGRPNLKIR